MMMMTKIYVAYSVPLFLSFCNDLTNYNPKYNPEYNTKYTPDYNTNHNPSYNHLEIGKNIYIST